MTAKQLGNQAAFTNDGMTLRQHYAGLALQGILANSMLVEEITKDGFFCSNKNDDDIFYGAFIAEEAIQLADALLTELAKTD